MNQVIKQFGLTDCKECTSARILPAFKKTKELNKIETTIYLSARIPYRQAIESLLYLSNNIRPKITYIVNVSSRKRDTYDL